MIGREKSIGGLVLSSSPDYISLIMVVLNEKESAIP